MLRHAGPANMPYSAAESACRPVIATCSVDSCSSEIHLQRELSEPSVVVGAAVIADTGLRRNHLRGAGGVVEDVVLRFLQEQIVMVEDVKSFRAKLEIQSFAKGKRLADHRIQVPHPGAA